MKVIKPIKITKKRFSKFGDLIDTSKRKPIIINNGYAKRFHDLMKIDTFKKRGKPIVSIFKAKKRRFPMRIDMMEKHPLGSQAFIPMEDTKFFVFVAPKGNKPNINKIVQDRLLEKNFINNLNINTTQYVSINKIDDLTINKDLFPGILKTSRFGYDGKGQFRIDSISKINNLKIDFKHKYILEKLIKIKKEISVIITRFGPESYEIYEPIENVHEDRILKSSKIPSQINKDIIEKAKNWAKLIADELGFIGTMCVEYFIDKNDNLFVNEIAPRVHNSGHLTINSYNVSQFENHIRAICKLEKIPIKKLYDADMINILGNNIEYFRKRKYLDHEFFFDYLKTEIKPNRKMGHLTTLKI